MHLIGVFHKLFLVPHRLLNHLHKTSRHSIHLLSILVFIRADDVAIYPILRLQVERHSPCNWPTSGSLRSNDPEESRYQNGGNVCLFSAATCTSQCQLRSIRANARLSALITTCRESLVSLSIAVAFSRKRPIHALSTSLCEVRFK